MLDQSWWFLPGDGSARLGLVDWTTAVTCFDSPPRPALSARAAELGAQKQEKPKVDQADSVHTAWCIPGGSKIAQYIIS